MIECPTCGGLGRQCPDPMHGASTEKVEVLVHLNIEVTVPLHATDAEIHYAIDEQIDAHGWEHFCALVDPQ